MCHCDWFNEEDVWPIAEQIRLGRRGKLNMLGKRRAGSGIVSRYREKQDGHDVLKKDTKLHGKK